MVTGSKGWIGVDMDGTFAYYDRWVGWNVFGPPIEPMIARMKQWLAEGRDVRVFTARVSVDLSVSQKCTVTGQSFTGHMMVAAIRDYCAEHVGQALPGHVRQGHAHDRVLGQPRGAGHSQYRPHGVG